jgi:hypothetical protein
MTNTKVIKANLCLLLLSKKAKIIFIFLSGKLEYGMKREIWIYLMQ